MAVLLAQGFPAAAQVEAQAETLIEPRAADEIPEEIPTSAFAAQSQLYDAQLSPDGSRFALSAIRDERQYISVFDSSTLELVDGMGLGNPDNFKWFRWLGNDRLLISMTGNDPTYGLPYSRLVAFDFEPRRMRMLAVPRMGFDGDNVIHYNRDGEYVLVSISENLFAPPDVWRFDLNSDAEETIPGELVERRDSAVSSWIADETGVIRIGIASRTRGRVGLRYRRDAEADWETVVRVRRDDEGALAYWDFLGLRAGSDTGYALAIPEGQDRYALIAFDFSRFEPGEVIFSSPDEDVDAVTFDENREPIAVTFSGDSRRRVWLDPQVGRWRARLTEALPGSEVTILDWSEDRSRMLVVQSGSADPGALYVFSPQDRQLDLFGEIRPQVAAELLVEPRSIRYDARDGTSIHAYLALPRGREARSLPLVVYPHGGPYGIRDTDRYDDTVQLLANRGYAVIQPNFRGSGGYGEAFERLGDGQVGRLMQDDLDDAVAHLVADGTVDPERVCIVGASYGGFAAVWGVIRNPEIYRCAASFAGVMHWERQLAHNRDYLYGRSRRRHTERYDGDQTDFDLDDISPAVQVGRLTRPVLLAHGERDSRVPYDQFELMEDRADDAEVELETLSLEESGHGFTSDEDRQAWYDALVDFLARHNPAD
ncbi:alpha/beta hydrolase family protein [Aurantiacibacter gilvus]|uniref:Prolyl oligopeptidase family serine peptidase n=1 Tax=Aurantiacibacter gilvus TaxID=3139141 RepID=A0ABU9IEX2_9SPHN